MKRLKEIGLVILPTALILVVAVFMFIFIRIELIETETEDCWNRLDDEVDTVSEGISVQLHDNMAILELMADVIQVQGIEIGTTSLTEYITAIRENTLFCKITIAFPNGDILDEDGTTRTHKGKDPSYEELVATGTCVTTRVVDEKILTEVVYCSTPITNDAGEVIALLIGTIECKNLQDYFDSSIYNGNGSIFIIDRRDGKFIMDKWHSGYLPTLEDVEQEADDIISEGKTLSQMIRDGEYGRSVNGSIAAGGITYSSFAPIPNTDWEVLVSVPEEYIFTTVEYMENMLYIMGSVGALLIILIMVFHVITAISAAKERAHSRELEMERVGNKTKTRFLSTMSHDIRTPLNGIIGMVDIIEKFNEDEERVKDCVEKIKISANYLLNLTNDMLDLNALDEGKVQLEEESIDLCEFALDLGIILEQRAKEQGVTCHIDCSRIKHPRVFASVIHIRRIMVNLVTNAIKYNRENGSVWISIEEVSSDDMFGKYRFVVRDNGIGMSEEFQKDMFKSFEQEAVSARSSDQGHGLGLAIVKRLTEFMDGSVEVESQKDIGTTFTVKIPFRIDFNIPVEDKELTDEKLDLTDVHVLVVEDNGFNMEIACVQLEYVGARITPATNGKVALEIFQDSKLNTFDLILMDVMMPEMDGLSATRAIRALDRDDAKNIPIIAMTANAFAADVKACIEAGMNEHVAKPLDMDVMARKIMKYIKK